MSKQLLKSTVTDFEVVDHGIDGAQYFQGCGVSFTAFEHVVTGCGDTFADAVDDALESISQTCAYAPGGFDQFEALIMADAPANAPSVSKYLESQGVADDDTEEDSEMYYYVSIRYNTAEVL